ncbi:MULTISPECIES: CAF17-like 4Fe-4S cluster assembly/insertion protein YgfZ [Mycobacterium]|uniref:tRNA-modifying protein YgfZ n=1 Tax=Mycobacterium persicum TaxID=1487726 RepID=A0AB38UYY5_9MYCO|nr:MULTISPECIES: folate-binding protein YgfZ [Mycobacterium]KZS80573.1 glycine cleavage system protein T [Mycobacterium persicum]ORB89546.1 folate-binding protein YgfZ [Mycobacterium persicum]ORB94995.1 folate-binding protein YgfZ [Mycobacterium persicum]ORC01743.1 folate-binding protein YgfZ [Mycobacterium persicum]ORC11170.1 folate-binding protein YgfZ [Mycobacterium kansasii]
MNAVPAPDPGPDAGAIWHFGDPLGEQRAAEIEAVFVDRSHRAVITLTGKDRQTWLHSISTQHVSDLPEGASTENLSLDGQGRVEDHWIQTELADTTYLDTEPWRGEPLLSYLRKMVFWAAVTPEAADLAVLSLLGPRLADPAVLDVLGLDALPSEMAAVPLAGGGFVRRMPAPAGHIESDLLVPRAGCADWQHRLAHAGVRPAGVWTYEAHRVAARRPRLGVDTDERTIPHEVGWIGGPGLGAVHLDKGCYRGQETVARVHNLGKPPRMLVLLHLDGSGDRPSTGDAVMAGGRAVGRVGTVVEHVDLGPIALALVKRGLPVDTELTTGPDADIAAVIDAESLPPADHVGAGRLAVERLRRGVR